MRGMVCDMGNIVDIGGGVVCEVMRVEMHVGVAGARMIQAKVRYTFADAPLQISSTQFYGSAYGTPGPIVVVEMAGGQAYVEDAGRFGETFDEGWVRRFYLDR